jgi:hypothetical protein
VPSDRPTHRTGHRTDEPPIPSRPASGGALRIALLGGVALSAVLVIASCDARLPEPESPGAQLYAGRCGGCHRIYAPQSMTSQMWKLTVARMQGELARRGLPILSDSDQALLLDYLGRHSTGHEG